MNISDGVHTPVQHIPSLTQIFVSNILTILWYSSNNDIILGMLAFTMIILIVNFKICLIQNIWTSISTLCWSLSILSWYITAVVGTDLQFFCDFAIGFDECKTFVPLVQEPSFWFISLLAIVLALGRHYIWNQYQRMVYPELVQILQERLWIDRLSSQTSSHANYALDENQHHHSSNDHHAPKDDDDQADVLNYTKHMTNLADEERRLVRAQSRKGAHFQRFQQDQGSPAVAICQKRATGYAFSCDEDTTLAESYLAKAKASNKIIAIKNARYHLTKHRKKSRAMQTKKTKDDQA